jgi:hypothetical protein
MSVVDKKVLVLAADLFEDMELLYPVYRLREEQVEVLIAGLDGSPVTGKKGHGPVPVDATVEEVSAEGYDGQLTATSRRCRPLRCLLPPIISGEEASFSGVSDVFLPVRDVYRSMEWYEKVLGFRRLRLNEKRGAAGMTTGDGTVGFCLVEAHPFKPVEFPRTSSRSSSRSTSPPTTSTPRTRSWTTRGWTWTRSLRRSTGPSGASASVIPTATGGASCRTAEVGG